MSDQPNRRIPAAALHQAAAWFARHDAGPLGEEERQAFDAWLARDPANRAAYARIDNAWDAFAAVPMTAIRRPHWQAVGRRAALGAIAAGLALAIWSADLPLRLEADSRTAVGETRHVALPDGSVAELNTDSAIAVDFGADGARRVRLLRGEAAFDVVKDPDHPFTVTAGNVVSRVLGTLFTVRRDGGGDVTVTLVRGSVGVGTGADGADGSWQTVLAPNQSVTYRNDGLGDVTSVDAQAATAWRRGKLVFQDRALGDVIDELNRYHQGTIRVIGADLARRPVSGVFDTRDPVAVVGALEAALDLKSTRLTDYLILLHR